LCVQKNKFNKAYAIEIQEKFAEIIKQNAKQNDLSDRVIPICADIRGIKPSDTDGELDVVCANPPYMKVDSGKRNEHNIMELQHAKQRMSANRL
jgi:tRNA1(Val) A37 N6-methylase TrmN6